MNNGHLPVAIIGAGPVGLAAAAHLVARGETPVVFETGASVGANVLQWGHVRLFSPWGYNIDAVARSLLEARGWHEPDRNAFPTGRDLVEQYLAPLAALPVLQPHIRLGTRVLDISRKGFDKMKTIGREDAPFAITVLSSDGREERVFAKAVIDASGTYSSPNPLGSNGVPALGERALNDRIFYGIPDILDFDRTRYAGRRVLVVGSGHSAFNAIIDLTTLVREATGTEIIWAVRRGSLAHLFGGGERDLLPARGALGTEVRRHVEDGTLRLFTGFRIVQLTADDDGITVVGEEGALPPVDEIIATTGFRPDLSLLAELRLRLDPAVESPVELAPLIDPNYHSCGTVRPHGVDELAHPEPGFYIAGMKSYGRAPTFLLLTGYEQVRSIVAGIAGDWDAARQVQLELPETGVCSVSNRAPSDAFQQEALALEVVAVAGGGCCSAPAEAPQSVTHADAGAMHGG